MKAKINRIARYAARKLFPQRIALVVTLPPTENTPAGMGSSVWSAGDEELCKLISAGLSKVTPDDLKEH